LKKAVCCYIFQIAFYLPSIYPYSSIYIILQFHPSILGCIGRELTGWQQCFMMHNSYCIAHVIAITWYYNFVCVCACVCVKKVIPITCYFEFVVQILEKVRSQWHSNENSQSLFYRPVLQSQGSQRQEGHTTMNCTDNNCNPMTNTPVC
jgi:hypothetical protein